MPRYMTSTQSSRNHASSSNKEGVSFKEFNRQKSEDYHLEVEQLKKKQKDELRRLEDAHKENKWKSFSDAVNPSPKKEEKRKKDHHRDHKRR